MKLVAVNPANIPTERLGRRGRVVYPLLKAFLESNQVCAKIDMEGSTRTPMSFRVGLDAYIKRHGLPIKVFSANGDLHLLRVDMDKDGNIDPNWKPQPSRKMAQAEEESEEENLDVEVITSDTIRKYSTG